MFPQYSINLILALLFGAAIGLERESSHGGEGSAGGIRTHALIALLGAVCGILITGGYQNLALLTAAVFFIMVLVYYALSSYTSKELGMTSELGIIFTFLIGLLPMLNIMSLQLVVALFVIVVLILSVKEKTKQIMLGISSQEIESFISYAIIALVVLPFLPNYGYKLADLPTIALMAGNLGVDLTRFASIELINPYRIWIVVVLITGIDVFGYVLGKVIGDRGGFTLASCIGGFISSTSTTQSLAIRSKKTGIVNYLVGAAVLANMASFLQIFLLVGPLNGKWLASLLPSLLSMVVASAALAFFFLKNPELQQTAHQENKANKSGMIFSLAPALKFAGLLIAVKLFTKISLILFGKSGFLISSLIASLAGLDAIMVNLAEMAGTTITFKFAVITFLLVNATNLAFKAGYSYLQGNSRFALKFAGSMFFIVLSSSVGLLFIE